MKTAGVAVYEEQVVDELLDDLARVENRVGRAD
jgi:hypothetical protein